MKKELNFPGLSDDLRGRDFIALKEFSPAEINLMVNTGIELKIKLKNNEQYQPLAGKSLGMIFHKASTRTRVSFQVGMFQLGGQALFFNQNELQLGRGEPLPDTARVMARYVDGIVIRTFAHQLVTDFAQWSDVPIINGLTDFLHPTQVLADLITIKEQKGTLAGLKIAYIGDGNNMAHSLMVGCGKVGMNVAIASPEGYMPDDAITKIAAQAAHAAGAELLVTHDVKEAVMDADVIYTDVWASMGQEEEQKIREKAFAGYQVNDKIAAYAKQDYMFLHCLPAHRGEEVTADIIDGKHSVVFDEAENRLHAHKAIMALTM